MDNHILKEIIYTQNKQLLEKIASDKYHHHEDKQKFIEKYLKKNYAHMNIVKTDPSKKYLKKLIRCVK